MFSQALTAQLLFSLFLCISAVSNTSNVILYDVLECGTSLPDAPPNLTSTFAGNLTSTCLYITISDQFGDGWANNSNLFYWAQIGDQDSNIVSVGLDCTEDCGALKSGCLTPLQLEGEGEEDHFIHLTLVSLNDDNRSSVPDYFWEMQWSVQIVKDDTWNEKYYGGFNTSMVFSYINETDDLSLSWAENLWQYPPRIPASCASPAAASSAEFFQLVHGDHDPTHQSNGVNFTANDTYFDEPAYSVVQLPEGALQQVGWLSCLPTHSPVELLYPGSYAFRAPKSVEAGDADWSMCGFSGHGQEELGFAVSKSDTCAGQYFGAVDEFCADAVTSFPSNTPTAAPTISEASAYFNSFDSATLIQNAPAYNTDDSTSSANRVIFSYHINGVEDFSGVQTAWEQFIAAYLVSPFDVEFYRFTVWASYLKLGSAVPVEWSEKCDNKHRSNSLIFPILSTDEDTPTSSVTCENIGYMSSRQSLCIGCDSSAAFSEQCSSVESEVLSLPTQATCYPSSSSSSDPMSKHAVVIEVFLREAVKASVPTLRSLHLTAQRQSISLSANITTTSSGGKLYCLATDAAQESSSSPSRAVIKAGGVAASIPPAAHSAAHQSILQEINMMNLFASTQYSVHCFTEDALGNQMAEEDIEGLSRSTKTQCCQVLQFSVAPSIVKFGDDVTGAAVAPTEFKFHLPRLPATNITVTPTFFSQATDLEVTSLTATKAFFLFDQTTSQLGTSRSFVAQASEKGAFYVRLVLSGDAAEVARYSADDALFQTQEVGGVLPAPTLASARMSDGGGAVIVSFAEPTDYGSDAVEYDPTSVWDCDLFLSFVGSAHTACSWQSDAAIILSFCGGGLCAEVTDRKTLTLLIPGNSVTLKAGLVRAKCESANLSECQRNNATLTPLEVSVAAPLNPLVPSVFITGSNPGGSCGSDLLLDATASSGGGGRAWDSFVWTVHVDSAGEGVVISDEERASAVAMQTTLNAATDLSYPLEVAYSQLQPVRYSVSLEVTNFLQESSFSSVFVDLLPGSSASTGGDSSVASKPSISIDGSSYRRIDSFEPLEVSISVQVPSCVSGNNTVYQWDVYRDITYQSHVQSLSANPKVMKLDPYSLSAGYSYRFQVTVTLETGASDVTVFFVDVAAGSVYVKINGPNQVSLPLLSDWTLDASDSVIEDVSPLAADNAWAPLLYWTCSVASSSSAPSSTLSFGDDCSNIFDVVGVSGPLSATVLIPLRKDNMLQGALYRISASAYSSSGKYVSAGVDIQMGTVTAEQAPGVTITSSFRKFNADRILQLFGSVSAPSAPLDASANVTMSWGVYDRYGAVMDLGLALASVLNTPVRKVRSIQQIASSVSSATTFSLSASPHSFTPGTEYAFRLSAEVDGAVSYASTTLVANAPPSSGKLEVLPLTGVSMTTQFKWNSMYWTDDLADFPLLYTFQYSLQQTQTQEGSTGTGAGAGAVAYSVVGLSSQRSYLTSLLPAGPTEASHAVQCAVSVSDFFGAAATAVTEVVVEVAEEGSSVQISFANFSASISAAVARTDWNAVAQDVSNAAALISLSDCQHAPSCSGLFRSACGSTTPPHTCGPCFEDYTGLAGASNVACYVPQLPAAAGDAEVGSVCDTDADCRYNSCVDLVCMSPSKTCPSASSQQACSGEGVCEYYNDATSHQLASCLASDDACSARCVCQPDAFGKACSLTAGQYWNRSMTRDLICESLQHLVASQDPSAELASFLAASAAASFDPSEVVSPAAVSRCLDIMQSLSNMTDYFFNEGLIHSNTSSSSSDAQASVVTTVSVQENFAELISSFVDTLSMLNSTTGTGTGTGSTQEEEEEEWAALGQEVQAAVNLAVTALSSAITSHMVPGEKSLDVVTGGVRLRVSFDSYSDLQGAMVAPPLTAEEQAHGTPISSIILPASGLASCSAEEEEGGGGGGSAGESEEKYARLSVMQWGGNPYAAMNSSIATSTATSQNVSSEPELMSRVLRFTPMSSSGDAGGGSSSSSSAVLTDPYTLVLQYASEQNWTTGTPGCGMFQEGTASACPCNVSYYDSFSVTLECYNLLDFCPPEGGSDSTRRRLMAPLQLGGHGGDTRHPHYKHQLAQEQEQRRRLDFDYGEPADDDAAPSGNILEYGGMFVSLGSEFVNTLSGNPLNNFKDLEAAKPVFIMMGFLMCMTALGLYICHRWDTYDRIYLRYVQHTTADKRYKAPSIVNLKDAFMEKTFVTQKRKSMMTFQEVGAKMRNDKARGGAGAGGGGGEHRPVAQDCDLFFDNVHHQSSSVGMESFSTVDMEATQEEQEQEYVPSLANIKGHMQDSPDTAAKAHETANFDKIGHKIATFFDTALPPTSLLGRSNGWTRFWRAIMREHDWFRIFSYSSLRLPRTIRFLSICSDVLILLFVDSIFFGVLFPNDGQCTLLDNTSPEECELAPSKFSSTSSLCYWDDETSFCAVRPPPATLEFYMIVAIVVTTFSIIPEAICHFVLEEYCAKQPVYFKSLHKHHDSANMHALSNDSDSDSDGPIQNTPVALDEKWEEAKDKYLFKDGFNTRKLYERYAYYDYTTPNEEAGLLLRFISTSLENRLKSAPIPWRNDRKAISGLSTANMEAIMTQLGIHADGSPVQLSWRKRVLCGTTPRQRVINKITRVRKGVDRIMDDMDNLSADLEDHQETALIQHFILEQLTPFKRFALKRQFFQFDDAPPEEIEGWKFVLGWSFMALVWTFCTYWIFMWAIANSGPSMASWSYEIVFVLLQDVLVNDLVQVVMVHVIAIEALRPQLKRIYVLLNQILQEKICTEASAAGDDTQTQKQIQEEQEESWDFCVAQHLSSACRAARRAELHYLPFSQLLMRITDYDVAQCRDERGIHLSNFLIALLAIPTALALSNEVVQDMFLDVVLPTAWSCFLIGNAYALILFDIWGLIVPYTLILCALVYRQVVVVPRIRKLKKEKVHDVEGYKYDTRQDLMWQNMNRQLQLVHLNKLNMVDYDPLRIQAKAKATSAGGDSASVRLQSARSTPRGWGDDDGSVMSEISAPVYHTVSGTGMGGGGGGGQGGGSVGGCSEYSMEHSMEQSMTGSRGQGGCQYDEISMGGEEVSMGEEESYLGMPVPLSESAAPQVHVLLPTEITQMQNHAARLQFIAPENSHTHHSQSHSHHSHSGASASASKEEKSSSSFRDIASGVGRMMGMAWWRSDPQQHPHSPLASDTDRDRDTVKSKGKAKGGGGGGGVYEQSPRYNILHGPPAGGTRLRSNSNNSHNSCASSPTSSVSTAGSGNSGMNPLVATDKKSRKKKSGSSSSRSGGGGKRSEVSSDKVMSALNFDSQRNVMVEPDTDIKQGKEEVGRSLPPRPRHTQKPRDKERQRQRSPKDNEVESNRVQDLKNTKKEGEKRKRRKKKEKERERVKGEEASGIALTSVASF